jgi:autotransporter-associated beta strand protein
MKASVSLVEPLEARIAPATFHWDSAGGGNWNDQNNWFNETTGLPDNGFPNAVDDVAKFTNANLGGATVTINGVNVTVGSILFDDDNTYQIINAANGTLTLSSATTATIIVSKNNGDASHLIAAPLILNSPLRITQDVTSNFLISSGIGEGVAGLGVSKTGAGPLTYTSTPTAMANTYTGTTTVEEGQLTFIKANGFNSVTGPLVVGGFGRDASVAVQGLNQIPDTDAVTVNAQGTVTLLTSETIGALTINGGTFSVGPTASTVLTVSSLNMTGGKLQMNVSNQILTPIGDVTATSDANGPAQILGGIVNLGAVSKIFTVNDGPQAQDLTVSSQVAGNSNIILTKAGPGTLRLTGSVGNTFGGSVFANAGTLELAKTAGNAISGPLGIGDNTGGAEADVVRLINPNQILDAQTVTVNGSGLLDTNGQIETIGTLMVPGGHVTTGVGGANLNIPTGLTLNAGHLTAGPGSQILLSQSNSIGANGQSVIDGLGSIGMFGSALSFNVLDSLPDVDLLVTIPITGANGINKTGLGTMELDAANTYAGNTLVFGRLIVNGSIGSVSYGSSQGTLAGTGTVGSVTFNSGALRPGTSPGVLHTGSIVAGGTPTIFFEIDGAKPGNGAGFHDQLAVTGTVDLTNVAASFSITASFAQGDQYKLIDNDGSDAVVGNFTGLPEGTVTTIGPRRYIITYKGGDGNDVVLTPEQSYILDAEVVPGSDNALSIVRDATNPKLVHITQYIAYVSTFKTYDVSLNQFANILIRGGSGSDSVYFDAKNGYFTSSFGNVLNALIFEGGEGTNFFTTADLSGTVQSFANYQPAPEPRAGEVFYASGFRAHFEEVAYYADEIPAMDYQVSGKLGAPDAFSFAPSYGASNHIGIDGQLGVEARYKSKVTFYGHGGADSFDIAAAGIDAPATIAIVAGADQSSTLTFHGTSDDDTFTLSTTSPTEGSVARPGQPIATYSGTLQLSFEGGAGADKFELPGANFDARIVGGSGADTLTFAGSTLGVALNLDQIGTSQQISASNAQLALGDAIESVTGSELADTFLAKPSLLARKLTGGVGTDTLIFDAMGTATTSTAGTVATPGFGALTLATVENSTLLNVPAKPVLGAQGNTFAAPLDFAVGKGALSLAVGDLNGDGRADFVTADSKASTVSIVLSTASGLLLPAVQKTTGGKKPTSVVLADFDGINGLDIAVTNAATGTIGILLNDGAGNFGAATTLAVGKTPGVLRAGDLDSDGDADLATIVGGKSVAIVKNTGGGTFAAATAFPTGAPKAKDLALADLDADNDLDLIVLHTGGQLATHVNDGTATFATPTITKVGAGASALAIADFNGDGKLDATVTHNTISRFVSVLLGKGDATFLPMLKIAYPLGAKASAVVASDFDGDGRTDLAIANGAGGRVSILRSLGTGAFTRALDLALEDLPLRKLSALALGDFDGDGRADLAVLSSGSAEVSVVTRA